jgi:hypothetical protein
MTAPTITRPTETIDLDEAKHGVRVGDPLIVDVRGQGSGWFITAVFQHEYMVYRDGRELHVPHEDARPGR